MANIWPVYEGKEPTVGGPWADLPLADAIDLFGLQPADFISDLANTPRFGDANRDQQYVGFRHVIVEIGASEATATSWKPGFYKTRVTPKEAYERLIQYVFRSKLGASNVVRVLSQPGTDSLGREAVKITVVIAPDALKRIDNGLALDALVGLQERLREMRENRTPIVEYATEAELAQDGAA